MKLQRTKNLFALIMMTFSISFLRAQTCKGNQVQMCKTIRLTCIYTCVPRSQITRYESQGWGFICACTYGKVNNKTANRTMSKKTSAAIPAENAIVLNKKFRK